MGIFFGSFTVPDTLASPEDLAAWTGTDAPTNATALLRSSTTLVLEATENDYYDTDPTTGLATDAIILKAMKDATCIQAAAWAVLGINPLAGGIDTGGVKKSTKLLSGSIEVAGADAAAAAKAYAAKHLVPDAVAKLHQHNLASSEPWTFG